MDNRQLRARRSGGGIPKIRKANTRRKQHVGRLDGVGSGELAIYMQASLFLLPEAFEEVPEEQLERDIYDDGIVYVAEDIPEGEDL